MEYLSIDEIKKRNREAGYHFFSRDTMRFFNSQVLRMTYPGGVFITSEKAPGQEKRRFTVRRLEESGRISTVSLFQQFETAKQAHQFAMKETQNEMV